MTSNIVPSIQSYNGKAIRINPVDRYTCLSDMASASGKKLSHWVCLDGTKAYLAALSEATGIPAGTLLSVQNGVTTWAHPKVAIKFASWCSPQFEVQVTSWIDELLTTGSVSIAQPSKLQLPADYISALKALVESEEQKLLQSAQIEILKDAVDRQSEVIDELFDYSSIIRIAKFNEINPDQFAWSQLKAASKIKGLEVKKAPCAIWGTKNLYSHDAWRLAYPGIQLPENAAIQISEAK